MKPPFYSDFCCFSMHIIIVIYFAGCASLTAKWYEIEGGALPYMEGIIMQKNPLTDLCS